MQLQHFIEVDFYDLARPRAQFVREIPSTPVDVQGTSHQITESKFLDHFEVPFFFLVLTFSGAF